MDLFGANSFLGAYVIRAGQQLLIQFPAHFAKPNFSDGISKFRENNKMHVKQLSGVVSNFACELVIILRGLFH